MLLNRTHQEAIRELLKFLGQTQKDLSDRIKYSPSALSEALRVNDPKAISEDKWKDIVSFFEEQAEAHRAQLSRHGDLTRVEQLLQELSSGSAGPTIHPPAGRLPSNARNYVERQCDQLLFRGRTSNIAEHPRNYPAILVRGGIQSGRSSLLQRLAVEAQRLGRGVRWIDLGNFVRQLRDVPPAPQLTTQIFRFIFEGFGIEEMPSNGADPELKAWRTAFIDFASSLSKHTFFLIDSVDSILTLDPGTRIFNDLILLLVQIRELAPDHVSMVVTYSAGGWPYLHGSPYANSASEVTTTPFKRDEIANLLQLLFGDEALDHVDAIATTLLNAFGGQPHLTHLAAYALKNHPSPNANNAASDVLQEAGLELQGEDVIPANAGTISGGFRTHWSRMRRELITLLPGSESAPRNARDSEDDSRVQLGKFLRTLAECAGKEPRDVLFDYSVRLFERVEQMGLLSGPFPGILSPFYRAAIYADPSYRLTLQR